ncbi:MAG TPA: gliding motility-associated C-terminal domain-containing protein [Saprospiraceae bacterium]|nr:gliding motility-associated C-terminal domain-containing protein [Saprospiraceae bacterium]HMP26286.1 gliding motility-associated C-terminal domain-containing protein [Saprospiraceae bacterium]
MYILLQIKIHVCLWLRAGLLGLLLLISFRAAATHIVGGEMNYTCLGNNRYEITLTVFRDCFFGDPNAWFDNPASIGVFDSDNRLLGQILVTLMNNDTLSPVLSGECFVAPPSVCVHTTTYRAEVELPFRAGGYQLAYQRCCRNQTILNILNPLASGATFGVTISERALRECNSSPKFKAWPPIYICAGEPIFFDQSAEDLDGDSIVYRLCAPLLGATQGNPRPQPPFAPPYDPVNWRDPPYNVDNMLNSSPDDAPLRIDPLTGFLTGTPNTIGQFVVGICIEEYRDGELISTTRRDFQYNVGVCGRPTAGFFAPALQCGDLEVAFAEQTIEANSFRWEFTDQDFSTEREPVFQFPDTGTYTVRLIVEPGTVCADTFERAITLLPTTLLPDFTVRYSECTDSVTLNIQDASTDAAANIIAWDWRLEPLGLAAGMPNPTFRVGESGTYTLLLEVVADNGCEASITKPIEVELLEVTLPDSLALCRGDTIALNPSFNSAYRYSWWPPEAFDRPDLPNPLVSPAGDVVYTVQITDADAFCQLERQIALRVAAPIDTLTAVAVPDTIFGRGTVQLTATFRPDLSYNWVPTASLNLPDIFNPEASPTVTTTYQVLVRNEAGCTATASAQVVVINLACEDPFVFIPDAFTPNGDGVNDVFSVRGRNIDELYFAVYNRWGQLVFETRTLSRGWDGSYRGQELPPDVYGYYAEVRCFDGSIFRQRGNVTLIR